MVTHKLKEGDVTYEQFRTMIVGEIKSKLEGMWVARKLASEYQLFQGRHSIPLQSIRHESQRR